MEQGVCEGFSHRTLWEVGDVELGPIGQVQWGDVASCPGELDELVEHGDERRRSVRCANEIGVDHTGPPMVGFCRNVVGRVVAKLLSMLDPTGIMAVINGFIAFFNAIQAAMVRARELAKGDS